MKKPIFNEHERYELINNTGSHLNELLKLRIEVYRCLRDIEREIPEQVIHIAKFTYKYRIPTILFYTLSILMIYKEEYVSAIIAVIIGLYLIWKS